MVSKNTQKARTSENREILEREIGKDLVKTGEESNQIQVIDFESSEKRADINSAASIVITDPTQTEDEFQVI